MTTLSLLTSTQLEQMKNAIETILSGIGVRVEDEGLRALYRDRGAQMDDVSGVVRLSPALLMELLSDVPKSFVLRDMFGTGTPVGGGEQPTAMGLVVDPFIADGETGKARPPRLSDVTGNTKINMQLSRVSASCLMQHEVSDVAGPRSAYRALEEYLSISHKPMVMDCCTDEYFEVWKEVAPIVAPGGSVRDSGMFIMLTSVISPLVFAKRNVEMTRWAAENRLLLHVASCPIAGATAPYSNAAMLAQSCAESLFGICSAQLFSPGTPALFGTGPSVFDMRSGGSLYYPWDKLKWKMASVEIGRLYGLPTQAECGGSLVLRHDVQQGAQALMSMLASVLSGADYYCGVGSIGDAVGMSSESLVYQHEWLRYADYVRRGISTGELSRSVDSIMENAPGGNFLCDELTLQNLRSDAFFREGLFDYSGSHKEARPMIAKVRERVQALTEGYESRVPGNVREDLARYFSGLYKRLGC